MDGLAALRYQGSMIPARAPWPLLLAASLLGCGSAPEPAPAAPAASAAPAAPTVDEAAARRAVGVALASLAKRNFDAGGCSPEGARVVPEAEARAATTAGESCAAMVAQQADRKWLVVIRSAAASQSKGVQATVIITPGGEGVSKIDYGR
jgi:hypothetical protein